MQSLLILGRQPALGIAELESLYGPDKLRLVGRDAVVVDVDPCLLAFKRLGGSLKFCKILTTLDTRDWADVEKLLLQVSPQQVENMPAGKMRLGLSLHGFELSPKAIMASGLKLKKSISKTGRSVRLVPNQEKTLNSAQVIHNKLTDPTGWELVIIRSDNQTIIAQTVMVQDIDSYSKRDRSRPKRDTRVGMLPPKLAQIIINLSVGKLAEDKLESICDIPADQTIPPPELGQMIFDPFCGTGVVMQEALLMGYSAFGSDLEPRMVDYSRENVEWLKQNFNIGNNDINYQVADATKATWATRFDFIASELYLGQPISNMPDPRDLGKIISNCDRIAKTFLSNLHKQTPSGIRIAIAVPAWQIRPGQFKHLPLIDQIEDLGYNRISFEQSSNEDLIYYRADQIVTRELLVLTRK